MPENDFVPPKDLAEVGQRMLQILDERGWNQGEMLDAETGKVCVQGALRYAVFGDLDRFLGATEVLPPFYDDARHRLDKHAREEGFQFTSYGCPSVTMNDNVATSEEDIRLLIKHALMSDE